MLSSSRIPELAFAAPRSLEHALATDDGLRWLSWEHLAGRDGEVVAVGFDITDWRERVARDFRRGLRRDRHRRRATGQLLEVNHHLCEFLGLSAEALRSRTLVDLLPAADTSAWRRFGPRSLRGTRI